MKSTLHRFRAFLGEGSSVEQHIIGERFDVLVTTGTGEAGYGRELGGSGAFAYETADVERYLDALDPEQVRRSNDDGPGSYTDFCEAVSCVEDRELALALAGEGLRLTVGGACTPVLTDAEYLAARGES